ncbi:hypothetical protein [Chryseobacterium kimseyorum]|nr:hypothetical protein [Chryseobacterium kimseyorum]
MKNMILSLILLLGICACSQKSDIKLNQNQNINTDNFIVEITKELKSYPSEKFFSLGYVNSWCRSDVFVNGIKITKNFGDQMGSTGVEIKASLDIYENYGETNVPDVPLSKVFLEKENSIWKITEIKFINREETPAKKVDFSGKWYAGNVKLHISKDGLGFEYHGQCMYFYPIKKLNKTEFEMIWTKEMDCSFDNGVNDTFGLKKVPEIGKPFAKYKLKNNILYAEYYYKDWVKKYSEKVQKDVFTEKYFRKNESN